MYANMHSKSHKFVFQIHNIFYDIVVSFTSQRWRPLFSYLCQSRYSISIYIFILSCSLLLFRNHNISRRQSFDSNISSDAPTELLRMRTLDNVHLHLNPEAASLLPLALK